MENCDFSDKEIVLFATSGDSGFGKTVRKLKNSVAESTELIEGKVLNENYIAEELRTWIYSLKENQEESHE